MGKVLNSLRDDTIAAIATAMSDAGIGIIRVSGSEAVAICDKIYISSKKTHDLLQHEPNTIKFGYIVDPKNEKIIDEVLISFFGKGKSYTLEDMVEINCHGGVYVTRLILNLLLKKGCRLAEPGEFTKRAYLNGRIDLSVADSVNDLIKAQSMVQAKSAIRGVNGSVERLLTPLMDEMKDVISMIEVNIDYPEYEDEVVMSNDIVKPHVEEWIEKCEEMIDKAERFRVVKDGINTVIIGKPNVGKSSLLNALLEKDKAIVTEIAGTTRDLVEGKVNLKNITLNLIDTAGIRDDAEMIEKIGIEKSLQAADEAELIILVRDASNIDEEDRKLMERFKDRNMLVVYNKSDLNRIGEISISAKNKEIGSLVDYLNEKYSDDISLVDEDILNNERQIALMKNCLEELKQMYANIDYDSTDIVVTNLDSAFHCLCQILGKEYQEDLIDHMFRNFCLGK